MSDGRQKLLRQIPSVDALLKRDDVNAWLQASPKASVTSALRQACDELRDAIQGGETTSVDVETLVARAEALRQQADAPSLRRVINATGIVLHTGLGRAPLSQEAQQAIQEAAGFCNVEFDLETGRRGQRHAHVAALLTELTGAEDAVVVNNNAAATFLIFNTLANGREAIVSRGQLVEIGGSYRLPDVMARSGAILREVGTTNRTRLADFASAVGPSTALLVHVHTSNYRVAGFSEAVTTELLAELGRERNLPVYDDLGSGALLNAAALGIPDEPDAAASIRAGADVVSFSGDKLLGGPQAGIIVGRANVVRRLLKNPLMRTYRPDKLTLAALEATLRLYRDPESAKRRIPALHMLTDAAADVRRRADALCAALSKQLPAESFEVCEVQAYAGAGSLPTVAISSAAVVWKPSALTAMELQARLRGGSPPVLSRVQDDRLLLDARTMTDAECRQVVVVAGAIVTTG